MNQIILASHGNLAKGMQDTLNMIVGEIESVKAFSSYRDEDENIRISVENVIKECYGKKEIYILTDIFGGSVNNEMMSLLNDYPKIHIIAGMNLGLVISIATSNEITEEMLNDFIKESKETVIYCNQIINESIRRKDEDL